MKQLKTAIPLAMIDCLNWLASPATIVVWSAVDLVERQYERWFIYRLTIRMKDDDPVAGY
jgi:hypothetical protein